MKESKMMVKKEIGFMKKKGAPKAMIKHEMAEAGMKKMASGGMPMVMKDGKKVPAFAADGEGKIVEVALRMANKLENSLTALELKTDDLAKKNLKLEQELGEIRLSNINLLREVEALKRQNGDLESICGVLVRENTHLKVELDNCIKKEI